MAGTNEELLINLESPEKNSNVVIHNHYLKNPLIPGPDLNLNELESNNPFDIVAQSAENWDPFELVLHQSLMNYGGSNKSSVEGCGKLVDDEYFSRESNGRLNRSNSVSHNVKFFPTNEKQYDKYDDDILNISSRSLDNSPSLRDKIKRVVKKRVGKCIERALNGSIVQSEIKREIPTSRNLHKSTSAKLENHSPKLKKDESQVYNLNHILEEAKELSVILNNLSISEEVNFSSTKVQKRSPLKEGKKSLSSPKAHEEDLMSIQPPWEAIDHDSSDSDDNSIGLPKVKLFYVKKKEKKNEINHEKLAHYKKRIRASIDGNMSCDEDLTIQEIVSQAIQSNEKQIEDQKLLDQRLDNTETEALRSEIKEKETLSVAVKPIVPVTNDLRLKKVGSILKKGPLKAIVPLQKMTKTLTEKISPLKKSSPNYKAKGKSCEDSTLSSSLISPVATSTPNSKNTSNHKKIVGTSFDSNSKPRSRLSRKDNEPAGTISSRRSVSLSTSSRKSPQNKQPFSSINPNDNQKWKRPHTAPSQNTRFNSKNSSPMKKSDLKKVNKKISAFDKENQVVTK